MYCNKFKCFALKIAGGSTFAGSRHGSTRSGHASRRGNVANQLWQGPSAIKQLYQILIEPLEDDLPEGGELMLVLEGDLYLVPFSMLRGTNNPEYLCERYSLLLAPSISSVKIGRQNNNNNNKLKTGDDDEKTVALVVGNPKLPSSVMDQWGWNDIPQAAQEAEEDGRGQDGGRREGQEVQEGKEEEEDTLQLQRREEKAEWKRQSSRWSF